MQRKILRMNWNLVCSHSAQMERVVLHKLFVSTEALLTKFM